MPTTMRVDCKVIVAAPSGTYAYAAMLLYHRDRTRSRRRPASAACPPIGRCEAHHAYIASATSLASSKPAKMAPAKLPATNARRRAVTTA
jgi:hypothetical protein